MLKIVLLCIYFFTFLNVIHSYQLCSERDLCAGKASSCCKQGNDKFSCCAFQSGSCSNDGDFCCPNGYKFNESYSSCEFKLANIQAKTFNAKFDAKQVCPDGTETCDDRATCCKMKNGKYGCCPFENADCCSDGEHCCPSEMSCDMINHRCVHKQNQQQIPFKTIANATQQTCPDGHQRCDDEETCCKMTNGYYGCCPFENANCCSDGEHCCPAEMTCDVEEQKCVHKQNKLQIPVKTHKTIKKNVFKNFLKLDSIICPGGEFQCPDGTTCCKVSEESWGCCPLENAVCCADHQTCCPADTTCSPDGCVRKQ